MPLTEEDRLRLENEALQKIVQRFANMRGNNTYVVRQIDKARLVLSAVKKRHRAIKVRDAVEEACFHVVNVATGAKIKNPAISIQRYAKNDWEAYIENFETTGFIGIGEGTSPVEAVRDLLALTKSYQARCKRGLENHRSV
jgi:hypothetical protein